MGKIERRYICGYKIYNLWSTIEIYKVHMDLQGDISPTFAVFCLEQDDLKGFGGFFMLSISNSLRVHSFCNGRNRLSEACE